MFINAIRFKYKQEDPFEILKIQPGKDKYSNLICYYDDNKFYQTLTELLHTFLTPNHNSKFAQSAAQITDNEGNFWILEKNSNSNIIIMNNRPLKSEEAQSFFYQAIADMNVLENPNINVSEIKIFEVLEIDKDENGNIIYKRYENQSKKSKLIYLSELQLKKVLEKLYGVCPHFIQKPVEIIVEFKKNLYPIYLRFIELQSQKESLKDNLKEFSDIDLIQLNNLSNELELINELEKFAKPLLNPQTSLENLEAKFEKIHNALNKELESCGINNILILDHQIPWEKLLEVKCQLEMYKKLYSTSEKLLNFRKNNIDNLYINYITTLEETLKNDTQITQELEACLSTLTQHFNSLLKQNKKSFITQLLNKFFYLQKKHEQTHTNKTIAEERVLFDASKMTIDFILGKIGELLSHLNTATKTYQETQEVFYTAHQTILKDTENLQKTWSSLAKEHGIPENYSLQNLIILLKKYSHLLDLWNKKQILKAEINNQKINLAHIERIILQWRKLTNSQKAHLLSSEPNLLLAEAQGILRYKVQKEKLLNTLREQSAKANSYLALRNYIDFRLQNLIKEWEDLTQKYLLQLIKITDPNLNIIFNLISKIENWLECLHEQNTNNTNNVWEDDTPIKLIYIKDNILNDKHKIEFLKQIENINNNNLYIIFSEDKKLYDMLSPLGPGNIRKFTQQQQNIKNTSMQQSSDTSKIINKKKIEAINILTGYKNSSKPVISTNSL